MFITTKNGCLGTQNINIFVETELLRVILSCQKQIIIR